MAGSQGSQAETNAINDFQKRMHVLPSKSSGIPSRYSSLVRQFAWSSQETSPLKYTANNDEVMYTANSDMDFMYNCYMTVRLPELKVISKYQSTVRVAWCPNTFHNLIQQARLVIDGKYRQYHDSHWLDMRCQIPPTNHNKRDTYSRGIGNIPYLQTPSDFIPSDKLCFFPPWYFCECTYKSIPLFLTSSVIFTYKYKLELSKLVRMMALNKEGKWTPIPYNSSYLDGISDRETIKVPKMFGKYSMILDSEKKWRLTESHKVLVQDVIKAGPPGNSRYGDIVTLDLSTTEVVNRIFWAAENQQASNLNYRSNYTTNPDDFSIGYNPVSHMKLNYGTISKLPKLSSIHFDMADSFISMPSTPICAGYNSYSISTMPTFLGTDSGVVTKPLSAKMTLWIKDTDPFLGRGNVDDVEAEEDGMTYPEEILGTAKTMGDPNALFKIHCYMLITTELTFEHGKEVTTTSRNANVRM